VSFEITADSVPAGDDANALLKHIPFKKAQGFVKKMNARRIKVQVFAILSVALGMMAGPACFFAHATDVTRALAPLVVVASFGLWRPDGLPLKRVYPRLALPVTKTGYHRRIRRYPSEENAENSVRRKKSLPQPLHRSRPARTMGKRGPPRTECACLGSASDRRT
jgi:hypothetical protein